LKAQKNISSLMTRMWKMKNNTEIWWLKWLSMTKLSNPKTMKCFLVF
jgi:hypothetical protein